MLPRVAVGRRCCARSTNIENYRPIVGDALIEEVRSLGRALEGLASATSTPRPAAAGSRSC